MLCFSITTQSWFAHIFGVRGTVLPSIFKKCSIKDALSNNQFIVTVRILGKCSYVPQCDLDDFSYLVL